MQMVISCAEFEPATIRARTPAGLAAVHADGRVDGRRKKLDIAKRRQIVKSVMTGRKTDTETVRLCGARQPTVSRIVAIHRESVR
jgi:DNA invertase Pin-like site-specific DNA recombinase